MNSRFLFLPLAVLVGLLGSIPPTYSQSNSDVMQEVERSRRLAGEANDFVDNVLYPLSQQQQSYERQLNYACSAGNNNACLELRRIEQRRVQWMIQNDCVYRTGLNSCSREAQ